LYIKKNPRTNLKGLYSRKAQGVLAQVKNEMNENYKGVSSGARFEYFRVFLRK
jgi:hypothetical protein